MMRSPFAPRRRWRLVEVARFVAAVALALSGHAARADDIIVSAAASLTNAFKEIGAGFDAAHPGTRVRLNFAASGALLQQMARGAPVDVFASADEATMDQAEEKHLIKAASRVDFASNALVVIVPDDAATVPRSLAGLSAASIRRVAIGLPASVPAGRYTRAALEKAKLWPTIEAKMIGAQSVRQALDYVARGEVDAGFVYATDAAIMTGKVKVAFRVPTATPIRYPIAVLGASPNGPAGQSFIAYVRSAAGQAVLAKYGFGKP